MNHVMLPLHENTYSLASAPHLFLLEISLTYNLAHLTNKYEMCQPMSCNLCEYLGNNLPLKLQPPHALNSLLSYKHPRHVHWGLLQPFFQLLQYAQASVIGIQQKQLVHVHDSFWLSVPHPLLNRKLTRWRLNSTSMMQNKY